jgi:superfamily II DNA or RNA helicase
VGAPGKRLKVKISNKLHLTQVPTAILQTLIERLQFLNPKWIENERMGRWNRGTPKVLKFFRRIPGGGLIIPRGFMGQLYKLCKQYDEAFEIDDQRRRLENVAFTFHGRLKPFQQTAVGIMMAKEFGTLCAPTGSGKTVMAIHMIARRLQPAIIIVHTKELALQWMDRIETFLGIPSEQIGFIGAGKKRIGSMVTVALVQSLYKCAREVATKIGHIVVDECHRAPSRTFTEAVTAFDCRFMLGLSATPWRRDRLSKLIFWHLGDMHHEVRKADLVSKGDLLDLEVIMRSTDFKPYYDPVNEYSKMLSELTSDDGRNRLIAADVAEEVHRYPNGGVCLVLSDRKRHCENLQALLRHKHHVEAELLTGDLSMDRRRRTIERIKKGPSRVLIATGQLIGEGFDCPSMSTLFLTTPVRFSGRVVQYLGRVLRPIDGVERARVFDYVDVHVAPLNAAAKARQRIYQGRESPLSGE